MEFGWSRHTIFRLIYVLDYEMYEELYVSVYIYKHNMFLTCLCYVCLQFILLYVIVMLNIGYSIYDI